MRGSEAIKKSCKYCGGIHEEDYKCKKQPVKKKRIDESVYFRNSQSWQNKRKKIRKRDNYLCQVCIRNLYNTERKYNYENLQVHHAVPLNADKTLKLDDNNLITLCEYHHYLCDRGVIPYIEIRKIIDEQNNRAKSKQIWIPPTHTKIVRNKQKHHTPHLNLRRGRKTWFFGKEERKWK